MYREYRIKSAGSIASCDLPKTPPNTAFSSGPPAEDGEDRNTAPTSIFLESITKFKEGSQVNDGVDVLTLISNCDDPSCVYSEDDECDTTEEGSQAPNKHELRAVGDADVCPVGGSKARRGTSAGQRKTICTGNSAGKRK